MIVGLVGYIGSGKGTAGDMLVERGFIKDSFAAPLKDAAANIFGWDRELLEGSTEESRKWREQPDTFWSERFGYDFTPRKALQWLGTESCRDVFHPDIWALSLIHRIEIRPHLNTVVTDVRFKNEIKIIREHGGKILRIQRGPEPDWYNIALAANNGSTDAMNLMTSKFNVHISEWDWVGSHIDFTIFNDGSLEDLESQIDEFLGWTRGEL